MTLAVVPVGAVEVDDLVTDDMLEYLSCAPAESVSVFSDTSGAVVEIDYLNVDATPSVHAVCALSGAGVPDTSYRFMLLIMDKSASSIIHQEYSDPFTDSKQSWSVTFYDLEFEKDYSIGFFLVDGNTTLSTVGAARSFTTPASGQSVGNSFFASINHHLTMIANSNNNNQTLLTLLLSQHLNTTNLLSTLDGVVDEILQYSKLEFELLGNIAAHLRYIEGYVDDLVPSAEETALKTATAETTKAVVETVFAEDSATKVTTSDVLDIAQVGTAASNMFNSGVSVGAFFDSFNDVGLIALFTDRTKNDLYAVEEVSTYGFYDGNEVVDYYSENLNKIQTFVGGDS